MTMDTQKEERNLLEKITFYFGLFILLLLIGYLVYQGSSREEKPPKIEVSAFFQPQGQENIYKVEIRNNGQETAQFVNIRFDLYQQGKLAESAVLEINFVPVQSKEEGWISFSRKRGPSDSLVVGAKTYLKP